MKTHTSRWVKININVWHLKARVQDGGAVLGHIEHAGECFWTWTAAGTGGWKSGRYAAQRAVRLAARKGAGR